MAAASLTTDGAPAPAGVDHEPLARRTAVWVLLIPAVLIVLLSFSTDGSVPPEWTASRRLYGSTALAAVMLAVLLAIRIMLGERPFAIRSRRLLAGVALLGLLAVWTLLSSGWSHAAARAIVEYDRVLLYVLAFVLLGAFGRSAGDLRLCVRAVALATVAVCICALITRLLPDVWQLAAATANRRLSYPLPYWNALGLLAAMGFVLCFVLSCDDRESRAGRVLAAAALPVLGATLLLTFSRGAIAVAIVALVAAILAGRPRALRSGAAVAVPTVGVAVAATYSAELLASDLPTSAAATAQGHTVAAMVMICAGLAAIGRYALLEYDGRPVGRGMTRLMPRGPATAAAAIVAALALALPFGAPAAIQHGYQQFLTDSGRSGPDLRGRLDSAAANGRADLWAIAIDAFADKPLQGHGAGTYALQLNQRGEGPLKATDAHSLYLEVLAELGIVGFLLVCGVVLLVLAGFLRAARGPDRAIGGALFGAGVAWALLAGIDWMWETPAVTLWFFAIGGLALAPSRTEIGAAGSRRGPLHLRIAGAAGCVALLILPLSVYRSDGPLREGMRAFARGDCDQAVQSAQRSIAALAARPEPHLLLGYCRVRTGRPALAMAAMADAVRRDPRNWETHYGLAIARARAGHDPRPRMRRAEQLRPRDPELTSAEDLLPLTALQQFATDDPETWRRRSLDAPVPDGPPP